MGDIKPIMGTDTAAGLEILSEKTVVQPEGSRFAVSTAQLPEPLLEPPSEQRFVIDEKTRVVSSGQPLAVGRAGDIDPDSRVVSTSDGYASVNDHEGAARVSPDSSAAMPRSSHENALVGSAMPLIHYAMSLVAISESVDMEAVRSRLISDIGRFEDKALLCVTDRSQVVAARYLLCSFIDEIVVTSPWGLSHRWSNESLLSHFHDETYGGDGFFKLLERAQQHPQRYLDLLELMYVCLSLGFAGRYRLDRNGAVKLESLREAMMTTIVKCRAPDNSRLIVGDVKPHTDARKRWWWLAPAAIGILILVNSITYLVASRDIDSRMNVATHYAVDGLAEAAP